MSHPRSSERTRGSALTELAICLLPYCLILLGVMLMGQLSLGKQESFKSVAWAGSRPEAQILDGEVDRHFFPGPGTATFGETLPYSPVVQADSEEPVLPYTAADIAAAASRDAVNVSHTTRVENGEVVVDLQVTKTRAGQAMEDAGLVSDLDSIVGKQELDPSDLGDVSYSFPVNTDVAGDIARTLTSWVDYSRSYAGFSYKLGAKPLPLETPGEDAEALRESFTMGGEDDDVFALQSASPNPEGFRGAHADGATEPVDLEAYPTMAYDSDAGIVDPEASTQSVSETGTVDLAPFWSLTYEP